MIDLQSYIKNRLYDIITAWDEKEIYAISFFINSNEINEYQNCSNVTTFSISYNTERDCNYADALSEKRWNYAFWRQNETPVFSTDNDESMKVLFDWYIENGIDNVGYEDYTACFDDNMNYIGKGPIGYYELLLEITAVAKKMQESGFIASKFGSPIPIIIHDLEYPWHIIEATKNANPNGEADTFLSAIKQLGFIE